MKPVMLALSTFRQSDKAVQLAIEKAGASKNLIVVYVADVNLARYLIGVDVGFYSELKDKCESELLDEHREAGRQKVESIVKMAEERGIHVTVHIYTGRFALECLRVIREVRPELVITTRSKRPKWVKKFFGSPVDYLIANAGCTVIEA